MPVAIDPFLDPALFGPERLVQLADTALREASAVLEQIQPPLILPIYLGLPELRPGFNNGNAEFVRNGLRGLKGLSFEIEDVLIAPDGHAAGFKALATAIDRIRKGSIEACFVGGVDSYFQPETMEWLDENRQLASADARSAFVPGEGASFFLLMRASLLQRLGFDSVGIIQDVRLGNEENRIKTDTVCFGEGLADTVLGVVRSMNAPEETISDIFCDLNGERYRGEEWGFVCLRAGEYLHDPTSYRSPADCLGDLGAASMPLFATLSCEAAVKGLANGSRSLMWASSEAGLRGAARIDFLGLVSGG